MRGCQVDMNCSVAEKCTSSDGTEHDSKIDYIKNIVKCAWERKLGYKHATDNKYKTLAQYCINHITDNFTGSETTRNMECSIINNICLNFPKIYNDYTVDQKTEIDELYKLYLTRLNDEVWPGMCDIEGKCAHAEECGTYCNLARHCVRYLTQNLAATETTKTDSIMNTICTTYPKHPPSSSSPPPLSYMGKEWDAIKKLAIIESVVHPPPKDSEEDARHTIIAYPSDAEEDAKKLAEKLTVVVEKTTTDWMDINFVALDKPAFVKYNKPFIVRTDVNHRRFYIICGKFSDETMFTTIIDSIIMSEMSKLNTERKEALLLITVGVFSSNEKEETDTAAFVLSTLTKLKTESPESHLKALSFSKEVVKIGTIN